MAKRFSLDKKDLGDAGKVFLYSSISAIIAVGISVLAQIDFPKEYAVFIPVVNTALVALRDLLQEKVREDA